jgi:hypothetical protein
MDLKQVSFDSTATDISPLIDIVSKMTTPGYKGSLDFSFPLGSFIKDLFTVFKTRCLFHLDPSSCTDEQALEFLKFTSSIRHIRTFVGFKSMNLTRELEKKDEIVALTLQELESLKTEFDTLKLNLKETNVSHTAVLDENKKILLKLEQLQGEKTELVRQYQEKEMEWKSNVTQLSSNHEQEAKLQTALEKQERLVTQEREQASLTQQLLKLELSRLKTDFALSKEDLRLTITQKCNPY